MCVPVCRDEQGAPLQKRSSSLKEKEASKPGPPPITSMLFYNDCSGDLNPFAGAKVRDSPLLLACGPGGIAPHPLTKTLGACIFAHVQGWEVDFCCCPGGPEQPQPPRVSSLAFETFAEAARSIGWQRPEPSSTSLDSGADAIDRDFLALSSSECVRTDYALFC